MTKTILKIVLLLAVVCVSSLSHADMIPDGNKRKGKYLLRKVYKACMKRGEVDNETPSVSPADKTQEEWSKIYTSLIIDKDKKNINKILHGFKCDNEWKSVSDKKLKDIFTYMYKHASDSSTPAKCK